MDIPITGINELDIISDKIKLYPNPTRDKINIEGIGSIESIGFYDVLGKLVYEISGSGNTIDVSGLNKGIYSLHVIDKQQQIAVKKIVIQ